MPFLRISSFAFFTSPAVSSSASRQSATPAPVSSRNFLISSILNFIFFHFLGLRLGLGPKLRLNFRSIAFRLSLFTSFYSLLHSIRYHKANYFGISVAVYHSHHRYAHSYGLADRHIFSVCVHDKYCVRQFVH